jgi:cysteine synthase A
VSFWVNLIETEEFDVNYINNITEAIGKTPLLKLNKVKNESGADVFVKLEHLNPSGSYKDRMAVAMIEAAEKGETWNGRKLPAGGTVVEASAGNTASALAMVCAAKSYKAKFVLYRYSVKDPKNSRMAIIRAYGPEVSISSEPETYLSPEESKVILETEQDLPHVIAAKVDCAKMEETNPNCVWVDQIYNKYNYLGQRSLAKEIYSQLEGKIDVVGCSVGAGGSLYGLCLGMKELGIQPLMTFGVVPIGSEKYLDLKQEESSRDEFQVTPVKRQIAKAMGLEKWISERSIVEQMIDAGYPDKFFSVKDDDARAMANRLCQEEGIFCGMSSGANVLAALKIASRLKKGQNVVTTIVDRRDRYLSETPNERYTV